MTLPLILDEPHLDLWLVLDYALLTAIDISGEVILIGVMDTLFLLPAGQGVLVSLQTLNLESSLVYFLDLLHARHVDLNCRFICVAVVDFC